MALDRALNAPVRGSEMITELYVPRPSLATFMRDAARVLRDHRANVIYGTVRLIERDDESVLAWARERWACVVLNLHVDHTPPAVAASADTFRALIDVAITHGGSYYLTYHRWARQDQVDACHPRMREFLTAKRQHDPAEIFQSTWYRHYRGMFASDSPAVTPRCRPRTLARGRAFGPGRQPCFGRSTVKVAPCPGPALSALTRSAVQLDEVTHDRQSEPEPAVLPADRAVGLAEPLEDERQKVGGDARAVVGDRQAQAVAGLRQHDVDPAAIRRELDRIDDEIADDLLQPLRVAAHEVAGRIDARVQRDGPRAGRRAERLDGGGDDPAEVHRRQLETEAPRHDAGHVEDVFDELRLELCVALDDLERAAVVLAVERAVPQHARPADDRVERRPQFVRERGEKVVLGAVGRLRLLPRRQFALEQPLALAFRLHARGQVAHESREARRVVTGHPRDRHLHRELVAVGVIAERLARAGR